MPVWRSSMQIPHCSTRALPDWANYLKASLRHTFWTARSMPVSSRLIRTNWTAWFLQWLMFNRRKNRLQNYQALWQRSRQTSGRLIPNWQPPRPELQRLITPRLNSTRQWRSIWPKLPRIPLSQMPAQRLHRLTLIKFWTAALSAKIKRTLSMMPKHRFQPFKRTTTIRCKQSTIWRLQPKRSILRPKKFSADWIIWWAALTSSRADLLALTAQSTRQTNCWLKVTIWQMQSRRPKWRNCLRQSRACKAYLLMRFRFRQRSTAASILKKPSKILIWTQFLQPVLMLPRFSSLLLLNQPRWLSIHRFLHWLKALETIRPAFLKLLPEATSLLPTTTILMPAQQNLQTASTDWVQIFLNLRKESRHCIMVLNSLRTSQRF